MAETLEGDDAADGLEWARSLLRSKSSVTRNGLLELLLGAESSAVGLSVFTGVGSGKLDAGPFTEQGSGADFLCGTFFIQKASLSFWQWRLGKATIALFVDCNTTL
jgi:hypothetical protein